jgi:hypothetical protein
MGTTELIAADKPEELDTILAWKQELDHAVTR